MRIATLIIGLLLGLLLFLQSFLILGLSSAGGDETTSGGGAIGVVAALLWLFGSAFAMAFPMISVIAFGLSSLFLFAGGASTEFSDLTFYGFVALALVVMSFFGWLGKRKERREKLLEHERQRTRDERLEQMMRQQMQSSQRHHAP